MSKRLNKLHLFFTIVLLCSLWGCITYGSPFSKEITNQHRPLPKDTEMFLYRIDEQPPLNSILVGNIKFGNSGATIDCDSSAMIELAFSMCRRYGANMFNITKHKIFKFSYASQGCHTIEGEMYRNIDESVLEPLLKKRAMANESTLLEDADYAIVHFYRPKKYAGRAINCKIHAEDGGYIINALDNTKTSIKVQDFDSIFYLAKPGKALPLGINVQAAQEYFVRCNIESGIIVGQPHLELVEARLAREEISKIETRRHASPPFISINLD